MFVKVLSLLNILLSILGFVLILAGCKPRKENQYKLYITRIILASLVVIFAAICIVNKIMVKDVWFFELMLILLQPLVVKDAIKYLVSFNGRKK